MANLKLGGNVQKLGDVVLSRVRTPSGLYLVKPIDMDKSFQPSPQLASYMDKIRKFEKQMLEKRKKAITKIIAN